MASKLFFALLFCQSCGLLVEASLNWIHLPKVPGYSCPDGWTKYEKRCYVFVADNLQWSDAEVSCINRGGNLASFHNKGEYDFIRNFVNTESGSYERTWVGGCNAAKEAVWLWSDGSRFDYTHWGPGEPNNVGGVEHCMEINFNGQDYVNDAMCSLKHPFVCARDVKKCFSCP